MAKKDYFKKSDGKNTKPPVAKKKRKNPLRFFKDVYSELKKVTWPTRKEVIAYTGAVLVFVLIFAILLGAMDWGFAEVLKLLVGT